MTQLLHLTLTELTRHLAERRASPVELMREVLARIDEVNPSLRALVVQRDRGVLLAEARASEARLGEGRGRPLEGIPLGVKDLEDAEGLVTSHGSKLFADNVATRDSVQVERLKAAGAIVVGKTNAPEFGSEAFTKNLLHGTTRSPWGQDVTPGGSSGGSSAALAAEMLPLVTASDGGGSIRIPASCVGAVGLKASYGRVPHGPLHEWEQSATATYGPLTKTVEDAALVLDCVVGHHPSDPRSLPHPGFSYVDQLARPLEGKLRIAFMPSFAGHAHVQSDVAQVVQDAARVYEALGHSLHVVTEPPPDLAVSWGLMTAHEIGGRIARFRPEREGEVGRGLMHVIRITGDLTPGWWGELARQRAALVAWCERLFSEHDLLLTPTIPYDPPPARGPYPDFTEGQQQSSAAVASFTVPFNLSWHPAISVRAGLSKAGLPVGMQLVAAHHRDDLLLRAALAFQRERPWHPHWPGRS